MEHLPNKSIKQFLQKSEFLFLIYETYLLAKI